MENKKNTPASSVTVYWNLKGCTELILMSYALLAAWQDPFFSKYWVVSLSIAQGFILAGAIIDVIHYRLLRKGSGCIGFPEKLVSEGGLFSYIRHPMYLGELLMMLGFTLWIGDLLSGLLFFIVAYSLFCQALHEEKILENQFPEDFLTWKKRTKRFFPFLF